MPLNAQELFVKVSFSDQMALLMKLVNEQINKRAMQLTNNSTPYIFSSKQAALRNATTTCR